MKHKQAHLMNEDKLRAALNAGLEDVRMPGSVAEKTRQAIAGTQKRVNLRPALALACVLTLMAGAAMAAVFLPGWIRAHFNDEETARLMEQGYGAPAISEAEADGLRMQVEHLIANGNEVTALISLKRTDDSTLPSLRYANVLMEGRFMQDGTELPAYSGWNDWYDEETDKRYTLLKSEFYDAQQMPVMVPHSAEIQYSVLEVVFPSFGISVLCPATAEGIAGLTLDSELAPGDSAADSLRIHSAQWSANGSLSLRYTLLQKNGSPDEDVYDEEDFASYQTSRLALVQPAGDGSYILDDSDLPLFLSDYVNETLEDVPAEGAVLAALTHPTDMAQRLSDMTLSTKVALPQGAKTYAAATYPVNQSITWRDTQISVDSLTLRSGSVLLNYHCGKTQPIQGVSLKAVLQIDGQMLEATIDGGALTDIYGSTRFYGVQAQAPQTISLKVMDGDATLGEWSVWEATGDE